MTLRDRSNSWLWPVVVACSSTLLTIVFIELAARLLVPDMIGGNIALRLINERPTWAMPDAEFHHVDSGAHRLDFPKSTDTSVKRIMIVGDSFVAGHGVSERDTFGYLFQRDLGQASSVAILGTTSYSPVIYRTIVQRAFLGARYRAVAVFVDQTDPLDELIYNEDLIQDGPPWRFNVGRIVDRQRVLAQSYDDMARRFAGSLNPRNLASVNLLRPVLLEEYFNPNDKYYTYIKLSLERAKFIGQFNEDIDSDETRVMFSLLANHLDQVVAECRSQAVPLFFVANPWEFQVAKYPRITLGLGGPFPKENRLERILKERYGNIPGVHVIPMTRYFRDAGDPSKFFISVPGHEVHWNSNGHALAERVLKQYMLNEIPDLAQTQ